MRWVTATHCVKMAKYRDLEAEEDRAPKRGRYEDA